MAAIATPIRLSSEDLLWAARMLEGEGGDHAATLYTMLQRWLFVVPREAYPTFASLLRAYSQPISPAWLAEGEKCRGRTDGPCHPTLTRRRAELQRKPWSEIDPEVQRVVLDFAAGKLPNPVPGAVDFASESVARSWLARVEDGYVILRRGNWYLGRRAYAHAVASPHWLRTETFAAARAGLDAGSALVAVATGLVAAWFGTVWFARRSR